MRLLSLDSPAIRTALAHLHHRVEDYLTRPQPLLRIYGGCNLMMYYSLLTSDEVGTARAAAELALYATLVKLGHGYGDLDSAARAQTEVAQENWTGR